VQATGGSSDVRKVSGALRGGPTGNGVLYFCVGSRSTNVCSYVWRLWWGRTSFYITTRENEVFPDLKVSLHGPDERHTTPGYKIGRDGSPSDGRVMPEGMVISPPDWLPCWFSGRAVSKSVTHVLRFRFPFNLFDRRYPSAPIPRGVRERDFAGVIPPPRKELYAIDVDVYVPRSVPAVVLPLGRATAAAHRPMPLWHPTAGEQRHSRQRLDVRPAAVHACDGAPLQPLQVVRP
jgi:hypothetical protein